MAVKSKDDSGYIHEDMKEKSYTNKIVHKTSKWTYSQVLKYRLTYFPI